MSWRDCNMLRTHNFNSCMYPNSVCLNNTAIDSQDTSKQTYRQRTVVKNNNENYAALELRLTSNPRSTISSEPINSRHYQ
jgi:hypothetical protein